jgi:radical SAM protein
MPMFDIAKKPFIIFWELTRACKLACKHCRAKAQRDRHPEELTTEQAYDVVEQVRSFGDPYPLIVITGGDPLMRDDVFDIIEYAVSRGVRTAIAFSGTDIGRKSIEKLKSAGISRIAISLDASTAEIHDSFRGVRGTFDVSIEILKASMDVGIPVQINTTVTTRNIRDLPDIAKLALRYNVALWDVFFVVPTGRAKAEFMPSSQEFEDILNWLYDVTKLGLNVKSSAATHFRRIELQREKGIKNVSDLYHTLRDELKELERSRDEEGIIVSGGRGRSLVRDGIRRMMGVTDGRGMLFISHVGEVYPSGFLPLVAGNIKETTLSKIYNESKIFRELKNPDMLKGKCGMCEFRRICGGSRARAYAMNGDYLAEEPRCIYQPRGS